MTLQKGEGRTAAVRKAGHTDIAVDSGGGDDADDDVYLSMTVAHVPRALSVFALKRESKVGTVLLRRCRL